MNAEFNWWLLIVGLVVGAGLTWLILSDSSRREVDIEDRELESESQWIADGLADLHRPLEAEHVLDVLRLHRAYRSAAPPDDVDDPWPATSPSADPIARGEPGDRPPMAHPIAGDPGRADRGTV